jgi:hypothetical protein
MMDRYVGFSAYQSLEHDEDIFNRCKFNKPFNAIEMFSGPLSDFLSIDKATSNSVYWLDFEIGLNSELLANLNSVAGKAKDGDIVLVTIRAEPPGGKGGVKHLLRSRLPSLKAKIDRLKPKDITDRAFPVTAGKLLLALLETAFAPRIAEGRFRPLFKVVYDDSMPMCTVGGTFTKLRSQRAGKLKRAVAKSLSMMCPPGKNAFYEVPVFNFTVLERLLLEKSVSGQKAGYIRRLTSLGLKAEELQKYEEVSRFVPKFIESAF